MRTKPRFKATAEAERSASVGWSRASLRIGGIGSFIVDNDRYMLAGFSQQSVKYVKVGQPVEIALGLFLDR
jgi:multidrug resistance efflux pump